MANKPARCPVCDRSFLAATPAESLTWPCRYCRETVHATCSERRAGDPGFFVVCHNCLTSD